MEEYYLLWPRFNEVRNSDALQFYRLLEELGEFAPMAILSLYYNLLSGHTYLSSTTTKMT